MARGQARDCGQGRQSPTTQVSLAHGPPLSPPGRAHFFEVAEPADKPGSVVDSHSSRRIVADTLEQPTRRHRGPRHCLPIWSCSRWGLPCRSVAGLAVRSYRTVSPLPDPCTPKSAGPSAVCSLLHFPSARAAQALPGTVPCGARTFLGIPEGMTRLSGRLRQRPLSHARGRHARQIHRAFSSAQPAFPARTAPCAARR